MKFIIRTAKPISKSTIHGKDMSEIFLCVTHSHNSIENADKAQWNLFQKFRQRETFEDLYRRVYESMEVIAAFPRIEIPEKYPLVKISQK